MIEAPTTWLVTGGAGYIGAHVTRSLLAQGLNVVVVDNFSTGHIARLPDNVAVVQADCTSPDPLRQILIDHNVLGVIHLAAFKQARESAREPLRYWLNNLGAMLGVLSAIEGTSVRHLVFSSSCSVYGGAGPVNEGTAPQPMSPYARTKYASELLLQDVAPSLGLSTVTLRFFNVVGNDTFELAHDTSAECLIPAAHSRVMRGEPVLVLGMSHPTPDGTAQRDYVDVRDLAVAHANAALYLLRQESVTQMTLDVGTGTPRSVMEVINALGEATGRSISLQDHGAHSADPTSVWAEASEIRGALQWVPQYDLVSSVRAHHRSVLMSRTEAWHEGASIGSECE